MFAVAPTDIDWFYYLKSKRLDFYINLWTPVPWNLARLNPDDRLYFRLKRPIKKVAGFGEFVKYENMSISRAWDKFLTNNGCRNLDELVKNIERRARKTYSHSYSIDSINEHLIGCIILRDLTFWDDSEFKSLTEYNLIHNDNLKFRYYYCDDPFKINTEFNSNFKSVINRNKQKALQKSHTREGQEEFRKIIFQAYEGRCCVSGENTPEVLEAAHIQPYINKDSNHVQNGLLLRADLHKLFDNNLIFIDEDYTIHISSQVKSEYYQQFHLRAISLPNSFYQHPSLDALNTREFDFVP
jgi:putative restriction endonuclease